MPNSTSYLAYPDVKEAFDRAVLGKGIKLSFKDYRAAVRFVARCNSYRVLDRKENLKLFNEGELMYGRSPYDILKVVREENYVLIYPITLDLDSITDLE